MSDAEEVKLSLRVMINKEKTKVLFAEVDNHFADIMFSFLTLPLGEIVKIIDTHYGDDAPLVGSLTTLFKGLQDLDCIRVSKRCNLFNPTSPERSKLKLNVEDTEPKKLMTRSEERESKRKRSQTPKVLVTRASKSQSPAQAAAADDGIVDDGDGDGGVFMTNTSSFVISDDLRVAPVVPGAIVETLMNVGIIATDGGELRMVNIGLNEIKDLLRGALFSKTPLTDVVLHKGSKTSCVVGDLLHQVEQQFPSSNSNRMVLKAMVQKSTSKLLMVEAEEDFVDFLSSFLNIPLGGVESLLCGNTSLKNIDNLYKSVAIMNGDKYFKSKDAKSMLLEPKLPKCSAFQNPFLLQGVSPYHQSLFPTPLGNYVKGQVMYNVTDDLTVTPFCLSSCISVLNELKIPLSDVREVELRIGDEEALRILKASLTSKSALTVGLMNFGLGKRPKQERNTAVSGSCASFSLQ